MQLRIIKGLLMAGFFTLYALQLHAQAVKFEKNNLTPVGVEMSIGSDMGKQFKLHRPERCLFFQKPVQLLSI